MTYNEYQDQKEQQQQTWFAGEKQRLRQEIWDNRGRARWCRNHPQDRNCK
jgi:5-methylcytosine-specific restriction endonuclease McrA